MPLNRGGFTLVELLVAAVVSGVLAVLTGGLVAASASRLRDRSERLALEQALRVSLGAATAMLEPLGADSGAGPDLSQTAPGSFVARSSRATGFLCAAASDLLHVRAGAPWWRAVRSPVAGRDSLLIATLGGADRWIAAPLLGAPATGACPDGSSAFLLPTSVPLAAAAQIGAGSPLRVFEPVELRIYVSGGASWIGLRQLQTGEAIQPLAGPFTGSGLDLAYTDWSALPATGSAVAQVILVVRGLTSRDGGVGIAGPNAAHADSAMLAVSLRGRP
ncbi:MAG TPA: type II secretion system protein [Gemmatimonadales bacterium]|nr:type II secretion system protein [Gemmatimonadales bacterium]